MVILVSGILGQNSIISAQSAKYYPLKIASFRWCAFCIVHFDIAEFILLFNISSKMKQSQIFLE
ncbi:hypothetical protein BpHYR1_044354 [Brachionus plicatilis]|uniref:Uncharacterized protein n=1 Tax=Brachionus plicatilis TaxID=10195 RepID=A0A3M7STH1_BRAPC|nr:hypothetical protein BpHYR1_044354 [Brachionus plicatilis]